MHEYKKQRMTSSYLQPKSSDIQFYSSDILKLHILTIPSSDQHFLTMKFTSIFAAVAAFTVSVKGLPQMSVFRDSEYGSYGQRFDRPPLDCGA